MRTLRLLPALALAAFAAGPAFADSAGGAESFDFLLLDGGARAVGMGGAYTALASDSNALLYNPAGLGRMTAHEATLMHNQYVQGVYQDYLSVASRQGFGASLNYLNFGTMPRTTIDHPDGTGSSFGLTDLALSGGYGRAFGPFALGGGVKLVQESVDNVSAVGGAVDGGAMFSPREIRGLTFGLSLLNVGPDVKFQSFPQKLPTMVRAGAAYAFHFRETDNTAAFDLTRVRTDSTRFGLGFETVLQRMMAFRLGFTSRSDADVGLTAGVGWLFQKLRVDYGFEPYGDLGTAHRLSVTYRWGGEKEDEPEQPRTESYQTKSPKELGPDDHFALAQAAIALHQYDVAKKELELAVAPLGEEDARRVLYYERQGSIAQRLGQYQAAKYSYVEALKLAQKTGMRDPAVIDAYVGMGMCFLSEKNVPYAIGFFKKALEMGPKSETKTFVQHQLEDLKP